MYSFTEDEVRKNLNSLFYEEATIHLSHPFGDISGPTNFYNQALKPLFESMPDLERRDYIVIGGKTEKDPLRFNLLFILLNIYGITFAK